MAGIQVKKSLDEEQLHAQEDLHRGLKDRHVQMIAIGGTIGVGLFLGSAMAIQKAGPGLVVSYAIGGLVMFFIMRAIGDAAALSAGGWVLRHLCGRVRRALGRIHNWLVLLVHVGGHRHGGDHRLWACTSITGFLKFPNGSRL